jgi:hypothetical protein
MDLFTVNPAEGWYLKDQTLDAYSSLIWTERYLQNGEVNLVLPASIEIVKLLSPGTLLGMNSSQELMVLDTRNIKGNLLTVTGKSLEKFILGERYTPGFNITDTPAQIIGQVVQNMIDWQLEGDPGFPQDGTAIPNFMVGSLNDGGMDETTEKSMGGPTYDIVLSLCQKYQLDFHVYWVRADSGSTFELHFQVRAPVDYTQDSPTQQMIRLSPRLDNLDNVEEVLSEDGFKSVALARAPQNLSIGPVLPLKVSKVPNGWTEYQPFKERIVEVDCTDIKEGDLPSSGTDYDKLQYLYDHLMKPRAVRELKQHVKTNGVDGEIQPYNPADDTGARFVYYMDYNPDDLPTYRVGDKVETQGKYGSVVTGNITEHVRAFDNSGKNSYPTVAQQAEAIVDPPEIAT